MGLIFVYVYRDRKAAKKETNRCEKIYDEWIYEKEISDGNGFGEKKMR